MGRCGVKIKALTGFAGVLSMRKGEITERGDDAVLRDLLKAGYVEIITDGATETGTGTIPEPPADAADGDTKKKNQKKSAGEVV